MILKYGEIIFKSSISVVYEATYGGRKYVVKIPSSKNTCTNEYKVLKMVNGVGGCIQVLKLIRPYPNKDLLGLVFCNYKFDSRVLNTKSDLFLDPTFFRKFTRTILQTVKKVHDKGIVHCDIKPSNIFVGSNNTPILADFGSCAEIENGVYDKYRTTEQYRDPTRIVSTTSLIDGKNDVYSLGCLLYFYFTKRELFTLMIWSSGKRDVLRNRKLTPGRILLSRRRGSKFSHKDVYMLQGLINKMTVFSKFNRISLVECLKHGFYS